MSSHHQYALIFYQSDFFANIFFVHFFISLFALLIEFYHQTYFFLTSEL